MQLKVKEDDINVLTVGAKDFMEHLSIVQIKKPYTRGGEPFLMEHTSSIVNAFTCSGAYAVLIMSGLKRVENRSAMPVPARGRCAMSVSCHSATKA